MLKLTRSAYDEIVHRGCEGGDEEVCGILAGEFDGSESHAVATYPAENVADRPQIRYAIDPEEQFEILERIEAAGREVVGFYHSHPAGPAAPSETDRERAAWPGYSCVICAFDGYPYLGSWRWRGDGFEQEVVAVEESG